MNSDGRLDPRPVTSSPAHGFAVTQMSLSANGRQDGVLWMIGCVNCNDDLHRGPPPWHGKLGALMALDATRKEPSETLSWVAWGAMSMQTRKRDRRLAERHQ
jgi:hypothetical protein